MSNKRWSCLVAGVEIRGVHLINNRASAIFVILIFSLALSLTGCRDVEQSAQSVRPIASITAPVTGSSFSVGQEVEIAFSAADVGGIAQVELSIDGQPVRVQTVDPPVNSFVATETWIPETPGSHTIEFRAFDVEGEASDPAQITVVINAPVEQVTPTEPPPEPTPTPTPVPVPPTPTLAPPTPTATIEEQPAEKAMVTALVGLNVRAGPSTDYAIVGRLAEGETAEIVGRNELSTWWQIIFSSDIGDRAWISAAPQFSTASNAEGVPVVATPPPTGAEPTPTPTSTQLKPTIFSFTADRYTIAPGESVTLRWDLANAQAAFLRFNGQEEGIVAPGSRTVSPDDDTVYTLVARNEAGDTTAEVTIKVSGSPPTPAPVYRDGTSQVASGQSIDFDRGIVQVGASSEADFLWDAQQRKISPQGSATGTLLGSEYDQINLGTCRSADFGQTIPQVDLSTRITGCYRTNEGRYGKFFVSEWDLSGNLTINWSTWNAQ